MEELPDAAIEAAEERPSVHRHEALDAEGLMDHVRSAHRLDAPDHLSPSTVEGLHDRLHHEADAAER